MPEKYERIRNKKYREYLSKGMKPKEAMDRAQAAAARIYNAQRKKGQKPVTGRH